MEKTIITTGFWLWQKRIEFDEQSISFYQKSLQCPFDFKTGKKRSWQKETKYDEIQLDENLIFFVNKHKLFGSALYLTHSSRYETLPQSEDDMASDDQDDWTFHELEDGQDKTGGPVTHDDDDDDEDYDDLYECTDTIQLRRFGGKKQALLRCLKASGAVEAQYCRVGGWFRSLIQQECLAYTKDWAIHVQRGFFSMGDSDIDTVPVKQTAFFVRTRPLLFGQGGVYMGYHRQMKIDAIGKNNAQKFQEWCKQYAPRLREQGKEYKSSIWANPLNLWRWIHPDEVTLTDRAVLYHRHTLRRDEMVYLPYTRINILLAEPGLLFRRFSIYGEQNISSKFSFSASAVRSIQKELANKGCNAKEGKSYTCSIWTPKNWFGRSPRLLLMDNLMVYYSKRITKLLVRLIVVEKQKEELGTKAKVETDPRKLRLVTCQPENIHSVQWCKPLFSFYGDLILHGTTTNIRSDQEEEEFYILMKGLCMFRYKYFFFFSGSLRNYLKSKTDAVWERKYKRIKGIIVNDEKELEKEGKKLKK